MLFRSVLLAGSGGVVGVLLGVVVTIVYARSQQWAVVVPAISVVGGLAAAVVIGGIAGLYPAARAARLPPTEALRAS